MSIKSVITRYVEVGECEVDVEEVIRQWGDRWFISQWHDKYTLVGNEIKVVISKRQAKEIIVELDLMPFQSEVFKNGKTWL
jgi:hypothetical protein